MKNSIKQQLKEKAKDYPVKMGVLAVKNKVTGRQLIQGALNIEALENRMKFSLKIGQYTHQQLQADWNEYGEDSFLFECIAVVEAQNNPYINYRQEVLKAEKCLIESHEFPQNLY
ncbi:LuxR family transcriptional regulator [Chryseobacterium sp. T16E-39]|uniref:GIY-YIG nuclease family protein n=1 Tax=Chryseobacterium sp. T16E-39 TaxID=2015076 RepID=UPI000B5B467B|nr:GIY-YIG nuclease family protein [Chryseobacterium sp. T16E-39]ASK31954.1 LuxR family transcriptional regulator [Chryseobacterium sp. T16E-39]